MSSINAGQLQTGFLSSSPFAEIEDPGREAFAPATPAPGRSDSIVPAWNGSAPWGSSPFGNGGTSAPTTDYASLSTLLSSFLQSISSMLSQFGSLFGSGAYGSTSTGASGAGPGTNQPCPSGGSSAACSPQTAFTNASATSWGDPHDTFSGTSQSGKNVNETWDNMQGHNDLLDSDSVRGGYRVSTSVSSPNAQGVAYNSSATVTSDAGRDQVTLNADGSYAVSEGGHAVTLDAGVPVTLASGETVTLGADKSLTIDDAGRNGGSIATVLSLNGHGVDVKATATGVDLGGYLVESAS